ncbi:MAG: HEPN domain-containing protein [Bacteroidales bacterium]|nr:HEPN domain-containing protein [Bacteroidales bacterium]
MMTKQEHIAFWLEQANDDWDAVSTLFVGKKYLQSLFFSHLVIEKICKAIWIKCNESNMPPRTHNLIFILSQTDVILQENISEFLLILNRFQLEGRYPEYMTKMHNICNVEFTKSIIEKTKKLRLWLIEKLQ